MEALCQLSYSPEVSRERTSGWQPANRLLTLVSGTPRKWMRVAGPDRR